MRNKRRQSHKWAAVCIGLLTITGSTYVEAKSDKPNIVIIYADDMGYGDCGAYNPGISIPTPNIDQLAKEGLLFTDAHSPGATCTASRYGLMTGISPVRTGVLNRTTNKGPAIDENEATLAQMLKDQGYATYAVGKWHLGFDIPEGQTRKTMTGPLTGGPLDRGFDYFYGNEKSGPSETPIRGREKITAPTTLEMQNRHYCEDVVRIIRKHAASDRSKPLFLYYALLEPHEPQIPEEAFQGRSGAGAYGDYIVQLDHWVGETVRALKETGLEENTIVVFASDNGAWKTPPGHAGNGVLAGCKGMPLEGGHRVPLIIKWPGRIPASAVTTALVCHTDFIATFAELLNVDISSDYPESAKDGFSFLSILTDPSAEHDRPPMAVTKSFRMGNWKIIVNDFKSPLEEIRPLALYNLKEDLSETTNLLQSHPEQAEALFDEFKTYLTEREFKSGPIR